jgi:hypothetical protein
MMRASLLPSWRTLRVPAQHACRGMASVPLPADWAKLAAEVRLGSGQAALLAWRRRQG